MTCLSVPFAVVNQRCSSPSLLFSLLRSKVVRRLTKQNIVALRTPYSCLIAAPGSSTFLQVKTILVLNVVKKLELPPSPRHRLRPLGLLALDHAWAFLLVLVLELLLLLAQA